VDIAARIHGDEIGSRWQAQISKANAGKLCGVVKRYRLKDLKKG
jgi:hypothetical protein